MQYRIINGDRLITTIGNRNLLKGTQNWQGEWENLSSWSVSGETYAGLTVRERSKAWSGLGQYYDAKPNTTYTFSFYAKASEAGNFMETFILDKEDWNSPIVNVPAYGNQAITTEWQQYSITFTTKSGGKILPRASSKKDGITIYVAGYKLEEGSVATPWSPAPEDYGITDHSNAYRVTGLLPNTTYQFSVVSFNGLRESPKQTVTAKTRGVRVTVPIALAVGSLQTLTYLEYPLGIVPIGTEPSGFFGGGNRQILPAKVVSSDSGMSTIEITTSFNLMKDNLTMKQIDDGSFAVYDSYKALFLKRKE